MKISPLAYRKTERAILKLCEELEYKIELTTYLYLKQKVALFFLAGFIAFFNMIFIVLNLIPFLLFLDFLFLFVCIMKAFAYWLMIEKVREK
jgi:hypothetical protein